jgi:phosphonate degradation associated HDIG domain protein
MSLSDEILRLFETRGCAEYHGEAVSQAEHALQAAHLAEAENAPDALVVAALLHDVGHLISGHEEDAADQGIDDRHEFAGAAWLSHHFGPDVVEPIRLHVAAKRYLCAAEPDYFSGLSPASRLSLELQGGPFQRDELAAFEANPHHRAAVRLRRWDDTAKVPGLAVPGLEHYLGRIESLAGKAVRHDTQV